MIPAMGWVVTFFVTAMTAAAFAFTGVATSFASLAQLLFVVFLGIAVVFFVFDIARGHDTSPYS